MIGNEYKKEREETGRPMKTEIRLSKKKIRNPNENMVDSHIKGGRRQTKVNMGGGT